MAHGHSQDKVDFKISIDFLTVFCVVSKKFFLSLLYLDHDYAPLNQNSDLRDVIINSNTSGIALDQEKVDQYIRAMSLTGSDKDNTEKLAAMWMYATRMGSLPPPSVRKLTPPSRPIMLIPASSGSTSMLATSPPMLLPPPPTIMAAGMPYRGVSLPYIRPGSVLYAHHPGSMPGTYRTQKSSRSNGMHNAQGRRRRQGGQHALRAGKMDANRRQRRKSEADVIDGQSVAFQYTGLDRAIADNFLARQEQSNASSHIDYSSSSSSATSEAYRQMTVNGIGVAGNGATPSRSSSKTKIVCRDVVM